MLSFLYCYNVIPSHCFPSNLKTFVTSAKEVMFSPGFVCEFVCAFVSEQDNSKSYGGILIKFSGYV